MTNHELTDDKTNQNAALHISDSGDFSLNEPSERMETIDYYNH